VHIEQGWQLVYVVVAAAVVGSSSRAAHLPSLSSRWAVMSRSGPTVLKNLEMRFGSARPSLRRKPPTHRVASPVQRASGRGTA
jgi:hypothetical protein